MPGLVKRPDCHVANAAPAPASAPTANHADHDAPLVIDEEDEAVAEEEDGSNLVIHNRMQQGQGHGHHLSPRPTSTLKAMNSNGGGGTRSSLFPMPPPPPPRYVEWILIVPN